MVAGGGDGGRWRVLEAPTPEAVGLFARRKKKKKVDGVTAGRADMERRNGVHRSPGAGGRAGGRAGCTRNLKHACNVGAAHHSRGPIYIPACISKNSH